MCFDAICGGMNAKPGIRVTNDPNLKDPFECPLYALKP
jgi:hypothetical protein